VKTCKKCKVLKPRADFYSASSCKDGLRGSCRKCDVNLSSKNQVRRRVKNPNIFRNTALKAKFGISLNVFNQMLLAQDNRCKICYSLNPGASKRFFSVDHDHGTGKIRGILCHGCNAGLGMFKDNQASLIAAAKYLEEAK
jgi:hypothetical protein